MATLMRMPEVLANATEAVIQTWLVSVGQEIAVGDPIAEIETDKAVVEYAAEMDGTVAELLAEPGVPIAVGDPIAKVTRIGEVDEPEDAESALAAAPRDPESAAPVLEDTDDPPQRVVTTMAAERRSAPAGNGHRLFATPLVRKLAGERGIDLTTVTGTGPGGRIVRRDLDRLPVTAPMENPTTPAPSQASSAEPERPYHDVPLSGMRRAIARRLTESKTTVPHFYVTADCRVDALLDLRRSVNAADTYKISVNDFVLKAVAGALVEVPEANVIFTGDAIRQFSGVDIAVAVAVEGGLLTPVVRDVDSLPLSGIATRVADLAERARAGKLKQQELEGGSFSVSNLGMYGVGSFSAILNPPHSGILAVGAAAQRPVVVDGALTVGTVMTVNLSADHRAIDGSVAAQWMSAFTRRIENPLTILI
ncbi:pyruvate dehydrogenase complex dihydrolipoamide acetyltransferase [Mycolicibacterium chubuense]|uniref:Dihydrolipoamide acetyltransferase component of pyruvate dehydrogenase complex n=1 Tax=Mycolicibacterium chubuense TaxID=1800 RepID=A0A0J6VRV1_MYCCU|nr:dihydrolipoamide acetyltransferase family protein [Mycolicibacterium chubuense]KMO72212.1 Dihydrolipoyllysine-residue acetyltransferase component of pyruvate dehydrogenase complex [Mycolicibacterium chubuense]ORA53018.1 pyruvate dehydrogenase complex dihydrolipoamide acetyltransferase [Mycolicibacterium chubuense]SPX97981.1 Putative dihydrolipoamide s-acetyltransferase component of pyruvate dehydrogenase complex E2 [Mycolicibacterium chubuense]